MITVFHEGKFSEDLIKILNFNLIFNKIFLITDQVNILDSLEPGSSDTLEIMEIREIEENGVFKKLNSWYEPKYFLNENYQRRTFRRAFAVASLLKSKKVGESIYHMDSDTLFLDHFENLNLKKNSYFRPDNFGNKYRMGDSIHFSYLNQDFADCLIEELEKFYKFGEQNWAIEKMKFHEISGILGEVSDMNFYYLVSQKINPVNLMIPRSSYLKSGGLSVFDFNISMKEGPQDKNYWSGNDFMKEMSQTSDGRSYFIEEQTGEQVAAITLHLQGNSKSLVQYLV